MQGGVEGMRKQECVRFVAQIDVPSDGKSTLGKLMLFLCLSPDFQALRKSHS